MKLLNKKQFLHLPAPTAYISISDVNDLEENVFNVKIKRGVEMNEAGEIISYSYQEMYGLPNEYIDKAATIEQIRNGESILNTPNIHNVLVNNKTDSSFLVFELEDMQGLILPLAECFDRLGKEFFDHANK